MNLNSLNIRKGLELEEVKVSDIFAPKIEAEGEIAAKDICDIGWREYLNNNENAVSLFDKDDGIMYNGKKEIFEINNTLIACVYDAYTVYMDRADMDNIYSEKTTEIEFINTEVLNFKTFCENIMDAQAFTGNYTKPTLKYSFAGTGNFSMSEYAEAHNIIIMSRIHMLDFFIFYKKIFSSIGFLLAGLFEKDIKQQKEYLNEEEYIQLIKECRTQRKVVVKNMNDMGTDFEV